MIYVLFIGLVCIFISIGCYHMETLVKSNVVYEYKDVFKVEDIQKQRETLITKLNLYIMEKVDYGEEKNIRNHMLNIENFRIYYGNSYVYYDKSNDLFKLEYILDNKLYKEETYQYVVKDGKIRYGCVDYSF
ncbi:hypothetical protein ACSVC9_05515 [Clostridium sp. LBM24168]